MNCMMYISKWFDQITINIDAYTNLSPIKARSLSLSLSLLSNELIQTEGETKTGESINPIPNGRTWKSFQNNYTERYYEVWLTKLASLNICSTIPFTQGSQVTAIKVWIWASVMFVIAQLSLIPQTLESWYLQLYVCG